MLITSSPIQRLFWYIRNIIKLHHYILRKQITLLRLLSKSSNFILYAYSLKVYAIIRGILKTFKNKNHVVKYAKPLLLPKLVDILPKCNHFHAAFFFCLPGSDSYVYTLWWWWFGNANGESMVAFEVVDPKRIYGRRQSLGRWNFISCDVLLSIT